MNTHTKQLLAAGLELNYRRAVFAATTESMFAQAPEHVLRSPHVKQWSEKLSQHIPAEVRT